MNYRLTFILNVLFVCTLSACSKGGGSAPDSPAAQPPTKDDGSSGKPGGPTPVATCPWDLKSSKTFSNYQMLGVEIKLDCAAITSTDRNFYQYSQDDLHKTLQSLDDSFAVIQKSKGKPSVISLGQRSFHNSNLNLIQLALGDSPFSKDVPHYIDATLQIMDLEQSEFGGQVRFNFDEVQVSKDANGNKKDIGSEMMFAPPQNYVDNDINDLKKFKTQILAHKGAFPDLVLFHGNDLSYFHINTWSGSYFFASDATDELNQQFFDYLTSYEGLIKTYAPTQVEVTVYRDMMTHYKADLSKSNQLIQVGLALKDSLNGKPIQNLVLRARESSGFSLGDDQLVLYFDGNRFTISNIFDSLGKVLDMKLIIDCVSRQDYSKHFSAKCPAASGH